jgi:hypothetical protein
VAAKKIARRAEKFLLTLFSLAKTDRFETSAGLFFRLSFSVLLYLPPTKGCKTALIGEKKTRFGILFDRPHRRLI